MRNRICLLRSPLHYAAGKTVYTASSGAIPYLDALYLLLETDEEPVAIGEVRLNIGYLTAVGESEIVRQVIGWIGSTDWSCPFDGLLDKLHASDGLCSPARALLDQTLHDGLARSRGLPLVGLWGDVPNPSTRTNQSLFWCDEVTLIQRAEAFVQRGFTSLKLRMGVRSFDEDLARLRRLRQRFGDSIVLSGDVNGQWPERGVLERCRALIPFGLAYLEQPLARSNWRAYEKLANEAPFPIMLDESAASQQDTERIAAIGGRLTVHLKLAKLGGLRPLIVAGRRLRDAGIPVMVGQMNEGALATAAATHAALVLGTADNELYGADGLLDDPGETLRYADGQVHLPNKPGVGPAFDASAARTIWQRAVARPFDRSPAKRRPPCHNGKDARQGHAERP